MTILNLRRRDQKTMPALPRRSNPNETQRYHAEHYNLASDYLYGLNNADKKLTMDEYVKLVGSFGKSMAFSYDRAEKLTLLPSFEELAELTDHLGDPFAIVCIEEEGIE